MLKIEIPGRGLLELDNLVLDFNGTIACGGELIPGVRERIKRLAGMVSIYILTADTFGTAARVCEGLKVEFGVLKEKIGGPEKESFICKLGPEKTAAIGNGVNDSLMLQKAALGIAVIEGEGASRQALMSADLVTRSINEALDLLLNPRAITATLRK